MATAAHKHSITLQELRVRWWPPGKQGQPTGRCAASTHPPPVSTPMGACCGRPSPPGAACRSTPQRLCRGLSGVGRRGAYSSAQSTSRTGTWQLGSSGARRHCCSGTCMQRTYQTQRDPASKIQCITQTTHMRFVSRGLQHCLNCDEMKLQPPKEGVDCSRINNLINCCQGAVFLGVWNWQ
jgi:hypothetical protein